MAMCDPPLEMQETAEIGKKIGGMSRRRSICPGTPVSLGMVAMSMHPPAASHMLAFAEAVPCVTAIAAAAVCAKEGMCAEGRSGTELGCSQQGLQ